LKYRIKATLALSAEKLTMIYLSIKDRDRSQGIANQADLIFMRNDGRFTGVNVAADLS